MAWELCNEPRCEGDFSGSILQDWVEQQAEFLKSPSTCSQSALKASWAAARQARQLQDSQHSRQR